MDYSAIIKYKEGKTEEQKKVIDYFNDQYGCGCVANKMTDKTYLEMVKSKVKSLNLRERALGKTGLDEDELKEIPPAMFEGYTYKNAFAKQLADGKWISSAFQVSWLFFSSTQIYIHRYTFNLDENKTSESTDEFFYKDVTSFSTSSETDKTKTENSSGKILEVETHKFALIVPGDKLFVSMDGIENAEEIIQGMKHKLREKKKENN